MEINRLRFVLSISIIDDYVVIVRTSEHIVIILKRWSQHVAIRQR